LLFGLAVGGLLIAKGEGVSNSIEMELFLLQLLSLESSLDCFEMGELSPSKLFFGVEWHNMSLLRLFFLFGLFILVYLLDWLLLLFGLRFLLLFF
jgi:hypothetical protein